MLHVWRQYRRFYTIKGLVAGIRHFMKLEDERESQNSHQSFNSSLQLQKIDPANTKCQHLHKEIQRAVIGSKYRNIFLVLTIIYCWVLVLLATCVAEDDTQSVVVVCEIILAVILAIFVIEIIIRILVHGSQHFWYHHDLSLRV